MNTAILRSRILDMAIHGQLVPQDPSEGTAMDLLKEIAHQRGKAITPITDNVPFSIPDNWCWVKLGDICTKIVDGDHNPPKGVGYKTEYKMLSSQNINYDKVVDIENCRYLSKETFDLVYSRTNVEKGDILLTCVGTLGRSCVYTSDDKIAFQRSVSVIRTLCIQEYIKRVFDCPYAQLVFIRESTGTAQKGFYLNKLQNLPIPLPPLPEQHRIVAKVEELLSEVDKIEHAQNDITQAATILRSRVLDMAIHGQLVPQDPNEGTADDLLKTIAAQRGKPITPITDNVPFSIPDNWCWVKLGDIAESVLYGVSASAQKEGKYKLLRITDIQDNKVNWDTVPYTDFALRDIEKYYLQMGDIVFARTGATVGKSYLIEDELKDVIFASYLIRVRLIDVFNKYVISFFNSYEYWRQITQYSVGIGQPNCNGTSLKNLLIPLPPLSEQCRIVAKVEELFAEIDKLK